MKNKSSCVGLFFAVIGMSYIAVAHTFTAASGDWFDAANWNPQSVPTVSDEVTIAGKTVTATGGITAASISLSGGASLAVGSKADRMNVTVTVAGDFTLSGGSSFRVYSGELVDTSVFATAYQDPTAAIAALWAARNIVSVGGSFTVQGNSTVYPDYAPLTATPIVFTCDTLTVEEGSSFSTKGLGWHWSYGAYADAPAGAKGRKAEGGSPEANGWTWAFGNGESYTTGAGYGANGKNPTTFGGKPVGYSYGFACAPFLSGSPAGAYISYASKNENARGSGAIVVYAATAMTVNGTMDADCKRPGSITYSGYEHGAASGGGIWLVTGAKDISFGPNAVLRARGGKATTGGAPAHSAGGRVALGYAVSPSQMNTLATGIVPSELLSEELLTVAADVSSEGGAVYSGTTMSVSGVRHLPVHIIGEGSVVVGTTTNTADFILPVEIGGTATLTAVEPEGKSFISWSGEKTGSRAKTVTVGSDESRLTARFGLPTDPTHIYKGATGGDWFEPTNWDVGEVPDPDANVLLDGKTVKTVGDVTVRGLSLTNGASFVLGDATIRTNVTATVTGDLMLDGASTLYYYSGELVNTNVFLTARSDPSAAIAELWSKRNVLTVGGLFAVRGNSTVYPDFAPLTATPIVFVCGSLFVEEGSSFSTKGRGWGWKFADWAKAPQGAQIAYAEGSDKKNGWTWAFGTGVSYQIGGGYGANGASADSAGHAGNAGWAYGSAYAPFLSGAPAGAYKSINEKTDGARGSGAITVYAQTAMTVNGTMDADCKFSGTGNAGYGPYTGHEFGAASGGGIWLATGADDISFGPNAALKARGGNTTTDSRGHGAGGRIAIATGVTAQQMANLTTGVLPESEGLFSSSKITDVAADVSSVSGVAAYGGTATTVRNRRDIAVAVSGDGAVVYGDVTNRTTFVVAVRAGETMTLTAVPDAGTAFYGWSGETIPGVVTMERTVSVGTDEQDLVASFGSTTGVARAWTGAGSTWWTDGRSWSPKGVPGVLDDVTVAGSGKTCLATNDLTLASLTVGDKAKLYVGGYNLQGSLEFTEERTAATIETVGDLTVTGGARLVVYAQELTDLTPFATMQQDNATNLCAALWTNRKVVKVGGDFIVTGSGSTVVPDAGPITGRPVVFEVEGNFSVLNAGAVTASARGWMWSTNDWSTHPAGARQRYVEGAKKNEGWCLAPGVGVHYLKSGGSYGAFGNKDGKPSVMDGVLYGCAYGFRHAPFVPGSPSGLYYGSGDFLDPAKPDYKQNRRAGGAVNVIAKGVATVSGSIVANGGTASDYTGQSGGGIWLVASDFAFGAGASLKAVGGDSLLSVPSGYYQPSSGGRIALGKNVGERAFARLTTKGRLAPLKAKDLASFQAAYPDVTVDLQSGLVKTADGNVRVPIAAGTFSWYEAKDEGLLLILR